MLEIKFNAFSHHTPFDGSRFKFELMFPSFHVNGEEVYKWSNTVSQMTEHGDIAIVRIDTVSEDGFCYVWSDNQMTHVAFGNSVRTIAYNSRFKTVEMFEGAVTDKHIEMYDSPNGLNLEEYNKYGEMLSVGRSTLVDAMVMVWLERNPSAVGYICDPRKPYEVTHHANKRRAVEHLKNMMKEKWQIKYKEMNNEV